MYRHRSVSPPGMDATYATADSHCQILPNEMLPRNLLQKERNSKKPEIYQGLQVPRQDWQENFAPLPQFQNHEKPILGLQRFETFSTSSDQFHMDRAGPCRTVPLRRFKWEDPWFPRDVADVGDKEMDPSPRSSAVTRSSEVMAPKVCHGPYRI